MNISCSATCDDAFLDRCTCSVESILHTELLVFHLCLCRSTYADNSYAAGELSKSLLKLLAIEVRLRLSDLRSDLGNASRDLILSTETVNDDCVVLGHLDRLAAAKLSHCHILELDAEFIGYDRAACKNCDILQHIFSSVAIARSLNSNNIECTAKLVDDKCCKSLTLNILSDDEQLSAALYDLLEHRQKILDVADLLVNDQDIRILKICFHLLHVGAHISGDVSTVELHTFYKVQLVNHCLGLFNRDNAVLGNLLHCICDHNADSVIACRDSCYTLDLLLAAYRFAHGNEGLNGCFRSFLHTLAKDDRVCTCCQVAHTFLYHCLCKNCSCCCAVAGYIICLGSNFLDELSAHILETVFKVNFLCDGNAVICNCRAAVCLLKDYISSFRSKCNAYYICQFIDACLKRFSCFYAIFDLFCHDKLVLLYNCKNIALTNDCVFLITKLNVCSCIL